MSMSKESFYPNRKIILKLGTLELHEEVSAKLDALGGNAPAGRRKGFVLSSVLALALGGVGAAFAFAFQYWAQSSYYVVEMGGKPHFEVAPAIIITFEFAILMAALGALIGFFVSARLPHWPDSPSFEGHEYLISLDEDSLSAQALEYIRSLCDSGLAQLSKESR